MRLSGLDRFIYLTDMFKIIESCSADLFAIDPQKGIQFWEINKCLLNYVNAVYSLKEYVNNYAPPLKSVTESYYNLMGWYRFICDYRNRIIHQTAIIKDFSPKSGNIYIDLDELIQIQSGVINESSDKHKHNAERFLTILKKQVNTSTVIDDRHYLDMKSIIRKADAEIEKMKNEVLKYAFNNSISAILNWLLTLIYWKNNIEQYVFIINEDTMDCFEPNSAIESFVYYILEVLRPEDSVVKLIQETLLERKYTFFFEGMKPTSKVFAVK